MDELAQITEWYELHWFQLSRQRMQIDIIHGTRSAAVATLQARRQYYDAEQMKTPPVLFHCVVERKLLEV